MRVSGFYLGFFEVLRVLEFHILNLILEFVNLLVKRAAAAVSREAQRDAESVVTRATTTATQAFAERVKKA